MDGDDEYLLRSKGCGKGRRAAWGREGRGVYQVIKEQETDEGEKNDTYIEGASDGSQAKDHCDIRKRSS